MPEWFKELIWMIYCVAMGAALCFAFIRSKYEIFPKGTENRIHSAIKDAFKDGVVMLSREISTRITQENMHQAWMWSSTVSCYRSIRRVFR